MAKELHNLPFVATVDGIAGGDFVLVKKTVEGVPLDFKVDINTLFSGYLQDTDIGTNVGDLIILVDSGGNAALPAVSAALLTNINVPQASDTVEGAVKLSEAINGTEGVTNGIAATPKAVGDLNALAFKKAGGEFTGAITLPNNTPFNMKLFSGNSMEVFKLDVNNDLLVGNATLAPDEVKIYSSNAINLYDSAGDIQFGFGADGTSSGIKALDVTAAAKTGLSIGTVDSQLGTLATTKLNSTGGTMSGALTINNAVNILGKDFAGTSVNLINISAADLIQVGATDADKTRILGGANGIELYTGGAVRFTVNSDGSTGGLKSADITFPTGTGGVVATDVQAAISWLGSNTLNATGGELSGSLTMANNYSYNGKNVAGDARQLIYMDNTDTITIGSPTSPIKFRCDDLLVSNSIGSPRLTMTDTGYLSGDALHASTMFITPSGGTVETGVQAAIYGLESRKINKAGGDFTAQVSMANSSSFACKETGGTKRAAVVMTGADDLSFGSPTNGNTQNGDNFLWKNSAGTTRLSMTDTGVLTGDALEASGMGFTPSGGLTSNDVQAAIIELNAKVITGGGAEFDGTINFANSVGVTTRNAADNANLRTIDMNSFDNIRIGDGDVGGILVQTSGSIQYRNAAGSTIFALNAGTGTLTGFKAAQIESNAVGNVVATDVQAAIQELDSDKLAKTGGELSGTLDVAHGLVLRSTLSGTVNLVAHDDFGAGSTTFGTSSIQTLYQGDGHLWSNGVGTTVMEINAASDLVVTGNITGTSDRRVKTNIKNIEGALAKVRRIGGQTFDRTDIETSRQMGVIAQKVEEEFPEAVTTNIDTGQKSVAYGNLAASASFAAIDELATIVEEQDEEISTLSIQLDVQADLINELKELVQNLLEK